MFIFPLNGLPHRLSSAFMVPIRTIRAPSPPDAATKVNAPPPPSQVAAPPSPESPPVADDAISAQGTGRTGRVTAPALHACDKGQAWHSISPSGVPESTLCSPSAVTPPLRRRRTTFTARNCHFLNALAASLPARGYPLTACLAVETPRPGSPTEHPPRLGMSCACLPAGSAVPCRRLFPRQPPVERLEGVGIRVEPENAALSGRIQ